MSTIIWTSERFYNNSYIFYLNSSWFYGVNIFFKNDVFLYNTMLLESSAVDNKNNQQLLNHKQTNLNTNITLFYIYTMYFLKTKIMLITNYGNTFSKSIMSIDKLYKSSSWLERETGEMFKVKYIFKTDTRRLLLDYSKQENPLLKDYPCEGFNDVFYSFFEDQVVFNTATVIEL